MVIPESLLWCFIAVELHWWRPLTNKKALKKRISDGNKSAAYVTGSIVFEEIVKWIYEKNKTGIRGNVVCTLKTKSESCLAHTACGVRTVYTRGRQPFWSRRSYIFSTCYQEGELVDKIFSGNKRLVQYPNCFPQCISHLIVNQTNQFCVLSNVCQQFCSLYVCLTYFQTFSFKRVQHTNIHY